MISLLDSLKIQPDPKVLCGPFGCNEQVRCGPLRAQLFVFSGPQAMHDLLEGVRDKWDLKVLIKQGYACMSVLHHVIPSILA